MPLFNPNPSVASQIAHYQHLTQDQVQVVPGNIDLFAKDFKLPQVFKASFAVDQKLP
jgi:hypothetical protein